MTEVHISPVDSSVLFVNEDRVVLADSFKVRLELLLVTEGQRVDNLFSFENFALGHPRYDHEIVEFYLGGSTDEIMRHTFTLPMVVRLIESELNNPGMLRTGYQNIFYLEKKNGGLMVLSVYRNYEKSNWHVSLVELGEYDRWNWGTWVFRRNP